MQTPADDFPRTSSSGASAGGWVTVQHPTTAVWHWFPAGAARSLCNRYDLPANATRLPGDDDSPANCPTCRRRLPGFSTPSATPQPELFK